MLCPRSTPSFLLSLLLPCLPALLSARAQATRPPAPLVVSPVDGARLATLPGTVHPLARAADDRGPVPESSPAPHLLLLLNRPPAQQTAFEQYLHDEHTPGSPSFHHWLTPAQIGSLYGPADSDVDAVTAWLTASGFSIDRVSQAKRFVEFSGIVGAVNTAFHTQIHQYLVDGVLHRANATPLEIPEALAPAIAAVSPLNDFRATPQLHSAGKAAWNATTHKLTPTFTGGTSWSPLLYAVAPADFATQYDLNPLYNAGVNGSGITIGIINESNIDLDVAAAYRSVFGLAANPVQVIVDGLDPGWNNADTEAYLDVEVSGAVAPAATVDLYLSAGSSYQDPLSIAALRAVEDNQADVLSVSFGGGEIYQGASGNQFWNALWEQAAAQGQTVLVASGDYGPFPDTYFDLIGVNGLASTPWDIAVGGTDFYYPDYASGAPGSANSWNATNDPTTKASLKAPLPEQVWNGAFGFDAIPGLPHGEIFAGGGGVSSCIATDANGNCTGGYPKPAWQSGPGVPADSARDLPDVSLFASNGGNFSAYAICAGEGSCTPDAGGDFAVALVGGTSASSPAMAGIIALVDQKYGRQGDANFTLYPLAQQMPSAFRDVTLGGNWEICTASGPDCTLGTGSLGPYAGESSVFSATPGYDQASGLGSIDASVLVNNWTAITFRQTATSLRLSPPSVVHGKEVNVSASVTSSSGSGTPTGAVTILTTSTLPDNTSQTAIPLVAGAGDAALGYLPGGAYKVTARYGGDGAYASSSSSPQALSITPEKSTLQFNVVPIDGISLTDLNYGNAVTLNAQPIGVNAPSGQTDGNATGSVTFTLDGASATVPLNAGGIAAWPTPNLSVGTHTASASYSGDASFQASSAQPVTFTVAKGGAFILLNPSLPEGPVPAGINVNVNAGTPLTISVEVEAETTPSLSGQAAAAGIAAPTGTVSVSLETYTTGWSVFSTQTATLTQPSGIYAGTNAFALLTFPPLAVGQYYFAPTYGGDANYMPFTCNNPESCSYGLIFINVVAPTGTPAASATTLTVTPSAIVPGQSATVTATVNAPSGATLAPTGWISFFDNGAPMGAGYYFQQLVPSTSAASASFSLTLPGDYFWTNGVNQLTAIYSGDANYQSSTSNTTTLSVGQTGADFTLTPQLTQINVVSGATLSSGVNLASLWGFNGSVALACATSTSDFSCTVTPASQTLNGVTTASLTITAVKPGTNTSALARPAFGSHLAPRLGAAFALSVALFVPLRRRPWKATACILLVALALVVPGCGSKSTSPPPPNPNNTPPGTYSILVTATAGSIVHNAKIAVLVTAK